MNRDMDCSVIIATHNRRPILARCIDCLRAQQIGADHFEIVVVDDGSTDGTAEAAGDPDGRVAVRLVRCDERRGPAAARNRGLEVARGDVAVFLDDDALAPPWFLGEHMRAHHREHRPLVVDGPAITVSNPTHLLQPPFAQIHVRLMARLDFFGRAFATVNASARISDVRRCGGFDEGLLAWEDIDLGRRLRATGLKRRRNRRAYVLHWKAESAGLDDRLRLAEERGRYAAAYFRRYGDRTARWQTRLRYLRYDAALVQLGLAGRGAYRDPRTTDRRHRPPIVAFELIHAYAGGLRAGLRQESPGNGR